MRVFLFCLALAATAAAQRRPAEVILTAPPLADYLKATSRGEHPRTRLFTAEAESYKQALRADKSALATRLAQRGATVRFQLETLLNALIVEATEDDLAWLRAQPGVASAEFSPAVRLHLDFATSLIGAPQVWQSLGSSDQTGRGVKVGVIDSGIDQTHPMFRDDGFNPPGGFPKTDNTADKAFTTNKVIVARNFVTSEPNAQDGVGHGTFVSSVIGGRSTATPLNTTINGVAPGAFLGNYKVFSAAGTGSRSSVVAAVNAAVDDGMDIVNYSGGSEPGTANDTFSSLVARANSLGVVIVVSASNCGPSGDPIGSGCVANGDFTIASPADVPGVISAGASTNGHFPVRAVHVLSPAPVPSALQNVLFTAATDPVFTTNIGPAVLADITPFDSTSQACNGLSAGANLSGKIALILRGNCNFTVKIETARQAGAIAVLFYNNSSPLAIPSTAGALIPSGIVSAADGAALLAFVAVHPDAQVRLDATEGFVSKPADLVSSYSSRGPNPDYAIKPDLVAPGDMYAAAMNGTGADCVCSPTRYVYAEGTSFSSPMTAGSAAALKAARPTLTPTDIKSALVNTAAPVTGTEDGVAVSVMNAGAGRLNLPAAMATTLASDPVSVSFGVISGSVIDNTQTLTLKNVGTTQETFDIAISQSTVSPGFSVSPSVPNITLAAGQTASLGLRANTTSPQQGIFEGAVTLKSRSTSTNIHIPYWMMFGTPSIATGGLVDGAGFGKNVSPGSIVSIFGSSLGSSGVGASNVPLPTDLGHTTAVIGSVKLPIFYSSAGQVNLQLPYSLSPQATTSILMALQGVVGGQFPFTPVAAAPGIFTSDGKAGIALHADYTQVTPGNPARPGETVQIYCTGLGAVSPAVTPGVAAPGNPLSVTASPTVMIGGQTAAVAFAGLAPGFVGLYQVNAAVPQGLSGPQTLVMTKSGISSNTVTLPVQ